MGELIELIIRLVEALSGGKEKKRATPVDPNWQAQQQEWERQRREWEASQQRQAQQQPVQPPPVVQTQGRSRKKARGGRQAAPPMPPMPPAKHSVMADLAPAEPIVAARPTARPPASARAIAQWARPGTLRSQFILTEVLKPPLSLRRR